MLKKERKAILKNKKKMLKKMKLNKSNYHFNKLITVKIKISNLIAEIALASNNNNNNINKHNKLTSAFKIKCRISHKDKSILWDNHL